MWDGVSLKGEKAWSYAMVQEHPDASNWTDGLRDKWARDRAVEYMSQHPIVTLRRVALKFADFWGLEREYIAAVRAGKYPIPAWFEIGSSAAVIVAYITTMILACVGAFLVTRRNWKQHVAPLAVVAWVCGIHAIVFGHSRYHLPLMPIVIAYAAAAAQGRRWLSTPAFATRRPAIALAVALLVGIWVHEVLFRDSERIRQVLIAWL